MGAEKQLNLNLRESPLRGQDFSTEKSPEEFLAAHLALIKNTLIQVDKITACSSCGEPLNRSKCINWGCKAHDELK